MIALLAACAVVWPLQNAGVDHGRVVTYRDGGDRIEYSRPVSRSFRRLVEHRQGTGVRVRCDR